MITTELVNELCNRVGENTDLYTSISDDAIRSKITEAVMEKSRHILLSANEKIELINLVFNRMRGMDILQPLLDNEEITEIMVNGPDRIFIEKKGDRSCFRQMRYQTAGRHYSKSFRRLTER